MQSSSLLNKKMIVTMHTASWGTLSQPFHDSYAKTSAGEKSLSQAWWCTPVIAVLVRLKQEDCHELRVSLGYKKWDAVLKQIKFLYKIKININLFNTAWGSVTEMSWFSCQRSRWQMHPELKLLISLLLLLCVHIHVCADTHEHVCGSQRTTLDVSS